MKTEYTPTPFDFGSSSKRVIHIIEGKDGAGLLAHTLKDGPMDPRHQPAKRYHC